MSSTTSSRLMRLVEPERLSAEISLPRPVGDALRAHAASSLAGCEVYCCGAPAMVAAVRKACVEERGVDPHHFFSDAFVPDPAAP